MPPPIISYLKGILVCVTIYVSISLVLCMTVDNLMRGAAGSPGKTLQLFNVSLEKVFLLVVALANTTHMHEKETLSQ